MMGREIRRVTADWEHPRDEFGRYQPLHDTSHREAAELWIAEFDMWRTGTHKYSAEFHEKYPYYWQWEQPPQEPEWYRPDWPTEARTHYQVYETVSEGTPVSPVLPSLEAVVEWAMGEGYSKADAEAFVEFGNVPSMVMVPGHGIYMGIASAGVLKTP